MLGITLSAPLWSRPAWAQNAESPCVVQESVAQQPPSDPATSQEASPAHAAAPTETGTDAVPNIRLSELLPDPEGSDDEGEFIEIVNRDAVDVDVRGWTLETASGKTFTLAGTVGARGRYAFTYAVTRLQLPNSGTTVTLRSPAGAVVDAASYPGPAKTGRAYARDHANAWRWTSVITQGAENAFDPEPGPAPMPAAAPAQTETDASPVHPQTTDAAAVSPNETAPLAPAADRIRISELLPDPTGSDEGEWVELQNVSGTDIALDGLFLDDADGGSPPFALSGIRIAANGYVVIPKSASKIAYNNTGDHARILNANGDIMLSVHYDVAPEGRSYAYVDGEWAWTSVLTPGSANQPEAAESAASPSDAPETAASGAAAEPVEETSVGGITDADDDALITVTGTVTLPVGVMGKRTFAIQDDGAAVIVRAFGNAPMPAFSAGDVVRVTGRKRDDGPFSTTGRMIARVGAGTITFAKREAGDLHAEDAGLAVRFSGTVTRRTATAIVVMDEAFGAETVVRAGEMPPEDALSAGAVVTVRGVIRPRGGKIELVAATIEAFAPAPADGASTSLPRTSERAPATFAAAPEPRVAVSTAVGTAGSMAAAAALVMFLRRKKDAPAAGMPADG